MRSVRELHPMMRNVLVPTAWVLLLMELSLTLFPKRTDVYFSWTILPPITAGAIGAFYVTGFALVMMGWRVGPNQGSRSRRRGVRRPRARCHEALRGEARVPQ